MPFHNDNPVLISAAYHKKLRVRPRAAASSLHHFFGPQPKYQSRETGANAQEGRQKCVDRNHNLRNDMPGTVERVDGARLIARMDQDGEDIGRKHHQDGRFIHRGSNST